MNNKGFTLIELILVIALLAVISLILTPNITKLIKKNKVDNYNSTIDSIIETAEIYVSENRYSLTFKDNLGNEDYCKPGDTKDIYSQITLQNLIDSKDISSPVENPCIDEAIAGITKIKVILNCKTKQFSFDIDETTSLVDSNDADLEPDKPTLNRRSGVTGIKGLKIPDGSYCEDLYG